MLVERMKKKNHAACVEYQHISGLRQSWLSGTTSPERSVKRCPVMPALCSSLSLILMSILIGSSWVLKEWRGSPFQTSFAPERILIMKEKKKTLCESYCGQGKANIKYSFSKQYLKQFILIPRRLYLSPLAGSSMFHGMVGHARSSARLKYSSELGTTDQLSGFSPRSSTAAVCLSVPVCTHAWLRDCVVALTRLSCDYSYWRPPTTPLPHGVTTELSIHLSIFSSIHPTRRTHRHTLTRKHILVPPSAWGLS